ncbi:MAG: aminotransferase class I/II-fold pyridoxal phosphate-dependent enzyme [Cyanobacteria bacterium]|nr:aminotransferase class I/II-fold pyridoxal phosphate-dependent enzyme [Cyanobacteriota bacterium]
MQTTSKSSTEPGHLKELSSIARNVPLSGIRRFFDIAAQMEDVVSLGVGEPDFYTPWGIREAAVYGIEKGRTTYTANQGLIELREEISGYLARLYDCHYDAKTEILVTIGVSQGLDLSCRVLINPGDEVLVPEPCFVAYNPCVGLSGGVPVPVSTSAKESFKVSAAMLERHITDKTKAILLAYPSNPTGATLSREELQGIVDLAHEKGLYIISDEIYDRLTYETEHVAIASLPRAKERTITLNGFSKSFAMTGWRLGYACAPDHIMKAMVNIHSHTAMCAPTMSQKAAVEALRAGEVAVADMVSQYKQRRHLIVDRLNQMGLTCLLPEGAFYAFPRVDSTGLSSHEFAERLLLEHHVAVVPGNVFGAGGEGHVRCSFAASIQHLDKALERMESFVTRLR